MNIEKSNYRDTSTSKNLVQNRYAAGSNDYRQKHSMWTHQYSVKPVNWTLFLTVKWWRECYKHVNKTELYNSCTTWGKAHCYPNHCNHTSVYGILYVYISTRNFWRLGSVFPDTHFSQHLFPTFEVWTIGVANAAIAKRADKVYSRTFGWPG